MKKRLFGFLIVSLVLTAFAAPSATYAQEITVPEIITLSENPFLVTTDTFTVTGGVRLNFDTQLDRWLIIGKNVAFENIAITLPEGATAEALGLSISVPAGMVVTITAVSGTADVLKMFAAEAIASLGFDKLLQLLPALLGKPVTLKNVSLRLTYMDAVNLTAENFNLIISEAPPAHKPHWGH